MSEIVFTRKSIIYYIICPSLLFTQPLICLLKQSLLPDVDSVLYMDSDSIFLTPPEMFWDQFNKMNSSQVIGIAQEDEIPGGYYHEEYGIPYYGNYGTLNSIRFRNLVTFLIQKMLKKS